MKQGRKKGVKVQWRYWTDAELSKLIQLLKENITYTEMANHFESRTWKSVYFKSRKLLEEGLLDVR